MLSSRMGVPDRRASRQDTGTECAVSILSPAPDRHPRCVHRARPQTPPPRRWGLQTDGSKGAPGPETSIFKIVASELGHRRDELMLRLRGTTGLGWEGGDTPEDDLMLTRSWLSAKATTIYGGTSEIQRNIVSKRVLRLPQPK